VVKIFKNIQNIHDKQATATSHFPEIDHCTVRFDPTTKTSIAGTW